MRGSPTATGLHEGGCKTIVGNTVYVGIQWGAAAETSAPVAPVRPMRLPHDFSVSNKVAFDSTEASGGLGETKDLLT